MSLTQLLMNSFYKTTQSYSLVKRFFNNTAVKPACENLHFSKSGKTGSCILG